MPSWSGFGPAKSNDGDRALQRHLARAALPYREGSRPQFVPQNRDLVPALRINRVLFG